MTARVVRWRSGAPSRPMRCRSNTDTVRWRWRTGRYCGIRSVPVTAPPPAPAPGTAGPAGPAGGSAPDHRVRSAIASEPFILKAAMNHSSVSRLRNSPPSARCTRSFSRRARSRSVSGRSPLSHRCRARTRATAEALNGPGERRSSRSQRAR
ncbi:hypothetical protein ACIO1C_33095 [Streptomyces sp. NPDC087420]|uniref:hypothetical protein n=1 Tax=Streptomyces sp. NPDC087420 TaxID=3365785 RepID=UPI0038332BA3